MRTILHVPPVRTSTHGTVDHPYDAPNEVPNAKRDFECWTSRVASMLMTVREPVHMTRRPSENMCKKARRRLFKPSAVEGGDKTILTIPLFNYNLC
jgi:hypothetical protein